MKRRVKVGEEFDAEIRLINAKAKGRVEIVRERIALILIFSSAVFLVGAAVLGMYESDFSKLTSVWNVAGTIVGGVIGFYFRNSNEDG